MRTKLSLPITRELAPQLGIMSAEKSGADLEVLVLRALYEQLSDHIDLLHAAFARLVTGGDGSPEAIAQQNDDMALFLDSFLTGKPFDLIARLRA